MNLVDHCHIRVNTWIQVSEMVETLTKLKVSRGVFSIAP